MGSKRKFKTKSRKPKKGCLICKKDCVDDIVPKTTTFRITNGCMTRSTMKRLMYYRRFIVVESYRCMPLIGGEEQTAPDWDIHIVRFAVVFV